MVDVVDTVGVLRAVEGGVALLAAAETASFGAELLAQFVGQPRKRGDRRGSGAGVAGGAAGGTIAGSTGSTSIALARRAAFAVDRLLLSVLEDEVGVESVAATDNVLK